MFRLASGPIGEKELEHRGQPCKGDAKLAVQLMSNLAVDTCPDFGVPLRSGRGFLGPRGLLRNALRFTRWAKACKIAANSVGLITEKRAHSGSGMAIIMPW